MTWLSLSPFILFSLLLFTTRIRLLYNSLISLFFTLILAFFIWQIAPSALAASSFKGIFVALDILVIVFGAIFFLEILKQNHIIDRLSVMLAAISPDYRVQIILLAWFLENFLEGTAGFGTPSTVVAPLLVVLGMSPVAAASVALLGNSTSVAFGAAGTPIRVGFAGLDVNGVASTAALLNFVGLLVPVFMLFAITAGRPQRWRQFFEALPFALFSGTVFVVISYLLVPLGQEFPSILGSIIGLFIVILAIKLNFLVPSNLRRPKHQITSSSHASTFSVIFPYALLVIFLLAGKFLLTGLSWTLDFGLKHTFSAFNPGFAFILASLPLLFKLKQPFKLITNTFIRSLEPFFVIALMSIMVQIMINSGTNFTALPSMLQLIADRLYTPYLPFLAPLVGAFGSFITGSATISNIMFGSFLFNAAREIGMSTSLVLSLGLVGGSAGNMISLADILPALAVVGVANKESRVIKNVIFPCLIYLSLVGFIGYFSQQYIHP